LTLRQPLWYPARVMARRRKKKAEEQDEKFQWCPIREARVSIETCRHLAFVEGEPACLRCLQQDLFAAKPTRARSRSGRKKP